MSLAIVLALCTNIWHSGGTWLNANVFGSVALIFWLIEPFLVNALRGMPLFLLLSIAFGTSFLVSCIYITRKKQWREVFKQPPSLFLAGLCGIWLSDLLYIYAARFAPIAYVELIDYSWPPLFVIFAILSQQHKFCFKELFGHLVSLAGLVLLLDLDLKIISDFSFYYQGYGLALVGAMLWAGFLTYSKKKHNAPSGMVGIYAGFGAMLSLCVHLSVEPSVTSVAAQDIMLAVVLGLSGFGLAYQFWDYGVKHGNIAWLSQANYLSRLLGIVLLYVYTNMQISSNVLLGSALILISFVIANWQYLRTYFTGKTLESRDYQFDLME